jgi:mannose-1-phosphate guanylyltransferase
MERESMAGAVLCAGLGTRLRPATLRCPKPALPFLGRSVASYALGALAEAGIKDVGVNLHHLPETMERAARRDCPLNMSLRFSLEPEVLGTGGGLRALWEQLGPGREVLLYHGDVLCGVRLREVIAAHRASGALATLVLKVRDPEDELRNVFVDETSQIAGLFAEHRHPQVVGRLRELSFAGIHVLSPKLFERLPKAGFCCLVTEIYTALLREGHKLGAYITTAFLEDLGTPDRFLNAQGFVMHTPALLPGVLLDADPQAIIEPGATLRGPVHMRGFVTIRAGAAVGPNVSLCAGEGGLEVAGDAVIERAAISGQGFVRGEVRDRVEVLDIV